MLSDQEMNLDIDNKSFQLSQDGRSDKVSLHIDVGEAMISLNELMPDTLIEIGAFLHTMGKALKARRRLYVKPMEGVTEIQIALMLDWNNGVHFYMLNSAERVSIKDANRLGTEEVIVVYDDGKQDMTLVKSRTDDSWFVKVEQS